MSDKGGTARRLSVQSRCLHYPGQRRSLSACRVRWIILVVAVHFAWRSMTDIGQARTDSYVATGESFQIVFSQP